MSRLLVFGLGYSAGRIASRLAAAGWEVRATTQDGREDTWRLDDQAASVAIGSATHILSSVSPAGAVDPVLALHRGALAASGAWLGYLSSTGVYGDARGAWVDESAPVGGGRRSARAEADAAWLALGARVFRLPGIYGPGRSPLDRVLRGEAHRVDAPGQVFSRVHVDDIASGVIAGLDAPPGAYNVADDLPASQNDIVSFAAALLGLPPPAYVALKQLSPMARGFYAENRRVANGKAKRVLGWTPRFPDYRAGLRALSAITSPTAHTNAPATASADQR